jgi:hypothetical protein
LVALVVRAGVEVVGVSSIAPFTSVVADPARPPAYMAALPG